MGQLLRKISDFLFPRYCAECGVRLEIDESPVCLKCNMQLPRQRHFENPYDNTLAKLYYGKVEVERVAAYLHFVPRSDAAGITYKAKYNNSPDIAIAMGRLMAQEAQDAGFLDGIDALVPVPLAPARLMQRGYNQSDYLAKGISEYTGIPVIAKAVIRTRFGTSQTNLTHAQRQENVEGVFQLIDENALAGKHILLIDDVITSGATTLSCCREIKKAPGCIVSILALNSIAV